MSDRGRLAAGNLGTEAQPTSGRCALGGGHAPWRPGLVVLPGLLQRRKRRSAYSFLSFRRALPLDPWRQRLRPKEQRDAEFWPAIINSFHIERRPELCLLRYLGVAVDAKLAELRTMYEPFVNALAHFFLLTMPPVLSEKVTVDNWQTSAWMRRTPNPWLAKSSAAQCGRRPLRLS